MLVRGGGTWGDSCKKCGARDGRLFQLSWRCCSCVPVLAGPYLHACSRAPSVRAFVLASPCTHAHSCRPVYARSPSHLALLALHVLAVRGLAFCALALRGLTFCALALCSLAFRTLALQGLTFRALALSGPRFLRAGPSQPRFSRIGTFAASLVTLGTGVRSDLDSCSAKAVLLVLV